MDESTSPDAQLSYAVRSPDAAHPEVTPSNPPTPLDSPLDSPMVPATPGQDARPRGGLAGWLLLSRPPTLVLGLAPVVLALALLWAHGARLALIPAICAPLAAMLALAGGNMLDEHLELARSAGQNWLREPGGGYYDGNVLEHSGIRSLSALRVSLALLTVSALVGIPVVIAGGVPVIVLGIGGLACVFLYSATSFALKRLPAGELVLLLALGPGLVVATVLSQRAHVSLDALLLGVALGLFAAALVEAAHLRDVDIDIRAGRRTLVTVLGERFARLIYILCIVAAFALVLVAALLKGDAHGMIAAILALSATLLALTAVVRAQGVRARHFAVKQTLRAYVVFVVWLGIGIVAWHLVELMVPLVVASFGG